MTTYYKREGDNRVFEKSFDGGFAPQGGGFILKDDGKFVEIPDPYTEFWPAWVGANWLDGVWPCVTNGQRWNGWGVPYFTAEVGQKLIATINQAQWDPSVPSFKWDPDASRFFYRDEDGEYRCATVEVAGVTYHAVGDGYTWEAPFKADVLAREFGKVLDEWLSEDEKQEIVTLNKTYDDGICTTGDFCDSNMAMHEAFINLGIVPPANFNEDAIEDQNRATDLWNEAWGIAKANGFFWTFVK